MKPTKSLTRQWGTSPRPAPKWTRPAIFIVALVVLTIGSSRSYAQSSPNNDDVTIPRAQYEQIKAALDELQAARVYIKKLEKTAELRDQVDALREAQAGQLANLVDISKREAEAERRVVLSLERALAAETRRAELLEKEVKRRRGGALGTMLKVAAIAIGIVAIAK